MEKILVIRKNLEKVLYELHKRSEKTWFFKYGNHGHKKNSYSNRNTESFVKKISVDVTT